MELFDLEETVLPAIGRTQHLMSLYIKSCFKEHGLNLSREQLIILLKLHKSDGLRQNELAHITNRDKTTLTRLINTMETNNMVVRIVDSNDKRSRKIYLTTYGRKILNKSLPILQFAAQNIQEGISVKERGILKNISLKIQNNLSELLK